jgi:hypothetical protein
MADTATIVQDQVLDSIKTFEGATLAVLKGWTRTLSSAPNIGELYSPPKMDTVFGFAERLWATQKDFMVSLLEVATEAGKTVPEAMKKTADRATSAASAAKP